MTSKVPQSPMRLAEVAAQPLVDAIFRMRQHEKTSYELTADGLRLISNGLSDRENELIRLCEEAICRIYQRAAGQST